MPIAPTLFRSLDAIRSAHAGNAEWSVIERFVRTALPAAKDADARQATLLAIHRHAGECDGTTDASVGGWIRRIARRKKIDEARRQRAGRFVALVGGEGEELELPSAGGAGLALAEDHVAETLAEVEASLDRLLEARHASPAARIVPRAQARARLYRTLGLSLPEIVEALGMPEPVTDATLSKWIERGLPLLVEAIEAWAAEAPHREALAEGLIARVEARRADAGKARPQRKKSMSVRSGPRRPRPVTPRSTTRRRLLRGAS